MLGADGTLSSALDASFHLHEDRPLQRKYGDAIIEGLTHSGVNVYYAPFDQPATSEMAIMWLWEQGKIIADCQRRNIPLLVVELGCLQPRTEWISLSWNGYNNLGAFAPAPDFDQGQRWRKYFAHHLKPWRKTEQGYALVMGQRPDFYLKSHPLNFNRWAQNMTDQLLLRGAEIVYRPHPFVLKEAKKDPSTPLFIPQGARLSAGTLEEDLAGAAYSVTFCSNVALDSVLAGVPTIAMDEASAAWPVTSHDLDNPFYYPDRLPWCYNMAWRQWTYAELADGTAWNHTKQAVPASLDGANRIRNLSI